jgi:periodic tryptophan protein 1
MSSQTLISSLTWIPRGRAAPIPARYELTDDELARVGKMGGEGVLEKLRKEMENMEVDDGMGGGQVGDDGDGDWEE